VANNGSNGNDVVELPTGATQETLPFAQLDGPYGVAVDNQDDVYVSNFEGNDVMSLPMLARHLYAALSPRGRGNCLDANDACDLATAIAKAAPEGHIPHV
jgi:DNA-binding beta-propeller fold protein YncE